MEQTTKDFLICFIIAILITMFIMFVAILYIELYIEEKAEGGQRNFCELRDGIFEMDLFSYNKCYLNDKMHNIHSIDKNKYVLAEYK